MLSRLPIRTRISLAILCLATGMLVLMSFAVYFAFRQQLSENLDDTLRLRAAANQQLVNGSSSPPTLSSGIDPGLERLEGEAILRLFEPGGNLLADASPAASRSSAEAQLVRAALATHADAYGTVRMNGKASRLVASPVVTDGVVVAILVTGLDRSQVTEPLSILRLILIAAVPITAGALGIGGFWIARSSLRPVARISATARQITEGDLRQRIVGVESKDEIGELAATLNVMIGRLAETLERERQFTADASHELRTPLAAIEASIDVTLSQDREAADYLNTLETVRGQTGRLANLTRQLLLLSRLDAGQSASAFPTVELCELVRSVVSIFASGHREARIAIQVAEPAIHVRADPELLTRALQNVLENAVVHAGPSATINVQLARPGGKEVLLAVEDDGPGVPDALRDAVFQRFRQGDDSRTRGGSGLGLAITQAIVQLHGGQIRLVGRASGTGARLEIRLPLDTPASMT